MPFFKDYFDLMDQSADSLDLGEISITDKNSQKVVPPTPEHPVEEEHMGKPRPLIPLILFSDMNYNHPFCVNSTNAEAFGYVMGMFHQGGLINELYEAVKHGWLDLSECPVMENVFPFIKQEPITA